MQTKVDERFWAKVEKTDGCWNWTGSIPSHGYGTFYDGRNWRVHRWSYERFVGPIPDGLVIDHLCRNKRCVNPEHLEPVTQAENVRRGEVGIHASTMTHCVHGHEYTPENVRVRKTGWRTCRQCDREYQRRKRSNVIQSDTGGTNEQV